MTELLLKNQSIQKSDFRDDIDRFRYKQLKKA